MPADGGACTGPGDRLPGACGQRHRPLRPRRSAGACPGHGISPAGCAHLWRSHPGGAVYPHRGGFAAALRYPLRRYAGDDPGIRGLRHGTEGLPPGQLPAGHAGGDGGGERRRGGAGLQPGRHDRRGHRLRHGTAAGRRGPGRVHRGHWHEEVPARRDAVRPVPGGAAGGHGASAAAAHHHPGGPGDPAPAVYPVPQPGHRELPLGSRGPENLPGLGRPAAEAGI